MDKLIKSIVFLSFFLLVVSPIFAEDRVATESGKLRPLERMQQRKDFFQNLQDRFLNKREEVKNKVEENREKSCEVRQEAIKKRQTQLIKLANNMETKFSSISARVQEYYTNKVVPSGKTLSNYNDLLSDIDSKKDAVDSALSTAQNTVDSFSCDADSPKTLFTEFRQSMQAVKDALKEYRTSIKNLIVAVKSLNSEESEE